MIGVKFEIKKEKKNIEYYKFLKNRLNLCWDL